MIKKSLKLYLSERPLTKLKVCKSANIGGVKISEGVPVGEVVLSCLVQDLDCFGRIFSIYSNRSPNRRQKVVLNHRIKRSGFIYRICQFLSPGNLASTRKGKGQNGLPGAILRSL